MNLYESTEQLLVDLIDYYEIKEYEAKECKLLFSAVDYFDKAYLLRFALNLVVSHHSAVLGCSVILPLCTRERQEQN